MRQMASLHRLLKDQRSTCECSGSAAHAMDAVRTLYGFLRRVIGHVFVRPLQRYNVEQRASKLLDKMEASDKPLVTAPKHKPTKAYLEQLIRGRRHNALRILPKLSLS